MASSPLSRVGMGKVHPQFVQAQPPASPWMRINERSMPTTSTRCGESRVPCFLRLDDRAGKLFLRHQFSGAAQFGPRGIRSVADFKQERIVFGGVRLLAGGFGGTGGAVEAVEAVGVQF